jgi:4-amino-4-deoxy-L-arabinose transferase
MGLPPAAPTDSRVSHSSATVPRWWIVLLVGLALGFGWLGSRGLGEPDETRYALVAHEMRESGEWLVPTLHQAPHVSKPPLTYWLVAAGQAVLGPSAWGSRLFLGAAFALTTLLVARFGQDLWGDPRGRWAGIVYATTLCPFVAASLVTTDTLLVLWETLALFAFWRSWRDTDPGAASRWRIAAWAGLGVAFATKGPPGLLPLLPVLVFRWLAPRGESPPRVLSGVGIAVFALIGLPWYAVAVAAYPGLADHFLGHEVYRRAVLGVERRHSAWWHPLIIYGPVLTVGALPWLGLALAAPRRLLELARRVRWRGSPRARLLLPWAVLPVILFSLASSRLYLYVLPVFPALALACTGACLRLGGGRFLRPARAGVLALVVAVGLLGLRIVAAHYPNHRDASQLAEPLASRVTAGTDLVVVGRPLHGFDLELGVLARVAGREAPPVGGACRAPAADTSVESLAHLERRRIFVADGEPLERLERRVDRAVAAGHVVCGEPLGETRTKAIVCDPRSDGPPPPRVAVLLDAAPHATALHALACRVRRMSDLRRVDAVYVLADPAARGAWRRRWLPPRREGLLWWLDRRGSALRTLPAGRAVPAKPLGGEARLAAAPLPAGSGDAAYGVELRSGGGSDPVSVRLTPDAPLVLFEQRASPEGVTAFRVGPAGRLQPATPR